MKPISVLERETESDGEVYLLLLNVAVVHIKLGRSGRSWSDRFHFIFSTKE
jgi:hypothetical protein